MDASIKVSLVYYPIVVLFVCVMIFLISVNQIINLATPSSSYRQIAGDHIEEYSVVVGLASAPGQSYERFKAELAASFPNQPEISKSFNISPEISKFPLEQQGNEIRLRILEQRIDYLQNELVKMSESRTEPLIFQAMFYFWGLLAWMCSIVVGRVLEHLTDNLSSRYFRSNS